MDTSYDDSFAPVLEGPGGDFFVNGDKLHSGLRVTLKHTDGQLTPAIAAIKASFVADLDSPGGGFMVTALRFVADRPFSDMLINRYDDLLVRVNE